MCEISGFINDVYLHPCKDVDVKPRASISDSGSLRERSGSALSDFLFEILIERDSAETLRQVVARQGAKFFSQTFFFFTKSAAILSRLPRNCKLLALRTGPALVCFPAHQATCSSTSSRFASALRRRISLPLTPNQ